MKLHEWSYDVFLSFRGEDTRTSFTGSLYHGLHQKGINVFIDDEKLRRGEQISPSLLTAIEQSRISIIVFSQNYASSTWCLDELVKILECCKTKGQLVWPVFYHVDPSFVRHQTGSFGTAMAKHEVTFKGDVEKLRKWKRALFDAANLSGWSLEKGYEFELILRIIEEVSNELNQTLLHIAEHPVGLETRISEVKSLLNNESCEDICFIGIHGHGGIGKTTIARALYNSIANQFEVTSFISDIRESSTQHHGLVQLQESLLYETVGDKNTKLGNVNKGIPIIKKRLCCKKVLLILDDVDKLEQLEALAGGRDWFGSGSKIIITTRDKQLLASHQVDKTYEVKKLNHEEAFELFTWNAFKSKAPIGGYMEISNNVVSYAEGLPLALKVMGSNLFGKSVEEWKSALEKYEKIPSKEVQNVLRVTYDNLEENEREIFLDIACFFKGETMEYVEKTLQACGFYPKFGISVLIDKSLVSVDEYNRLKMHDLIQDMGREVVREVSPLEPGKRSRLWYHEDVIEVLTENSGTYRVQGMMVDLPDEYMVHLKDDSFKKMKNLKILIVRKGQFYGSPQHLPNNLRLLDWMEYPSSSLPSSFHPKKLVLLNLSRSRCTMQEPFKHLDCLTSMDLSHCEFLTKLPDTSGVPNLTELNLDHCTNLEEVHDSVGFLDKLIELRAYGCTKLKEIFEAFQLQVMVPGKRIPEWFDHYTKGEYMTFWVQNQFPEIILCFVLEIESEMKKSFACEIRFYINSEEVYELEIPISFSSLVTDHVWLYDLRTSPSIQWNDLKSYLVDDWNQIEISCEKIIDPSNLTISWCGIHVCSRQEASMKDILFEDPDLDFDSSKENVKIDDDLDKNNEESIKSIEDFQKNLEGCEILDRKIENLEDSSIVACHNDMDHNEDNILMHSKTLDGVSKDSMAIVCYGSNNNVKEYGLNMVVADHQSKAQQKAKVINFIQTPNAIEEAFYANLDDEEMESFYAILDAETSHSNEKEVFSEFSKMPSEKTKKALKTLKDFLNIDFSVLLRPSEYNTMKDTLDYLTNLPVEEGISIEIRSLVIEVSKQFNHWSYDYKYENKKIEYTEAKLLKVDELEEGLEANKTLFREVKYLESDLSNELVYLEERKKELEEQISVVKANICASQGAKNMAIHTKKEIFEKGKILKVQRDELREEVDSLRDEKELAKKIQQNIRDEWSKLGEKFSNSIKHEK
ncbi:TMV resistance protein N isoform X2 [Cicer arietinum]|uniref:TMV resistance protein N isoform X2 n=1 Tax=Cicer arietinum TaxID=3827 RepID=UPI003CC51BD7